MLPDLAEKPKRFDVYEIPEFRIRADLFTNGQMFLHLDWPGDKFSPSLLKKGLLAIARIRRAAASNGIPKLYVFVPDWLEHWEQLWGFITIEYYFAVNPETGLPTQYALMEQNTDGN